MKPSTSNAIRDSIVNIVSDTRENIYEIEVSVSPQTTIYSLVTPLNLEEFGSCSGRSVTLLIKAPSLVLLQVRQRRRPPHAIASASAGTKRPP